MYTFFFLICLLLLVDYGKHKVDWISVSRKIQVVRQREVKDPPIFRGDASDTVTLDEWVELMKNFIRKGFLPTEEQGEEI